MFSVLLSMTDGIKHSTLHRACNIEKCFIMYLQLIREMELIDKKRSKELEELIAREDAKKKNK